MRNIDLKDKKNRSLALMLVGGLFCVLPLLMVGGVFGREGRGLDAKVICLNGDSKFIYRCSLVDIEVGHLMGVGMVLIAYGVFVRFSKGD